MGVCEKNLSAICVMMVLEKHTKGLELLKFCHGMDPCLLNEAVEEGTFIRGEIVKDLEGCYLYWDNTGKFFIRSGKVTGGKKGTHKGRTFEVRHKEHKKGSTLTTFQHRQSQFYSKYPSCANNKANLNILGHFENLTQYCAFPIDRSKQNLIKKICNPNGQFLEWPTNVLQIISKDGQVKGNEFVDIQLDLVSYLFELCYDLCLSRHNNISQSPGFEKFIGQFGKGRSS
jgi:hypothetical protein